MTREELRVKLLPGGSPDDLKVIKYDKLIELRRFLESSNMTQEVYEINGHIEIQFHGWSLALLPDGSWCVLDTSGG